ncbi:hypothetical protein KGQ64_12135 [bacterium]|nr:hypothetical protein [bacterium]
MSSRIKTEEGGAWSPVLPEQVLGAGSEGHPMRGVRALMIAVLENAIACMEAARRSRNVKKRLRGAHAERWMRSTDTSYPFTFQSICDALSLDGDLVRRRILARVESGDRVGPRPPSARRIATTISKITTPRKRIRPSRRRKERKVA